jgi:hypothetical protein
MTRNIDVGTVVDRVFKTYQRYFAVLVSIAAILFVVEAVVRLVAGDRAWLGLIATIVGLILSQLYTGMVVEVVNDTRDGQLDSSIGGLFNKVTPVLLTLIGAAIVTGIAIAVGLVACILPGIALLTLWAVVAPAVVIERRGVFDAMSRSWNLVKSNFWQTLGVIVVFWIITFVITGLIGFIFRDSSLVVAVVVAWIVHFLLAPLSALASSILFFELRGVESGVAAPPSAAPASTGGPPGAPYPTIGRWWSSAHAQATAATAAPMPMSQRVGGRRSAPPLRAATRPAVPSSARPISTTTITAL